MAQLPPAIIDSLTQPPDIYALYGRSQARVAQLETVVARVLDYLKTLTAEIETNQSASEAKPDAMASAMADLARQAAPDGVTLEE